VSAPSGEVYITLSLPLRVRDLPDLRKARKTFPGASFPSAYGQSAAGVRAIRDERGRALKDRLSFNHA